MNHVITIEDRPADLRVSETPGTRYRYVCTCGLLGEWGKSRAATEGTARNHVENADIEHAMEEDAKLPELVKIAGGDLDRVLSAAISRGFADIARQAIKAKKQARKSK